MAEGPTYVFGDMWQQWNRPQTAFIVTTNASVNRYNEAVMGRGIAKQLRALDHCYAKLFGSKVQEVLLESGLRQYGCQVWSNSSLGKWLGHVTAPMCWVGMFQVKKNYSDTADPLLIERSVHDLKLLAEAHREITFNLNYPGIGFGRLTECVVEPLLRPLPQTVCVWRFPYQEPVHLARARRRAEEEQAKQETDDDSVSEG